MTREMYRDVCVKTNSSVNKNIIGNIIENYKDNNDNESYYDNSSDATGVLRTARDGDLIYGSRVSRKDDGWYLEFQDGKLDGPYQQIEYDAKYLYCTIIFGLAYRYELSGLLSGFGSEYGYYAYLKKFIDEHKDEYAKFKKANREFERSRFNIWRNAFSKWQRGALFELDYRHQKSAYIEANQTRRAQEEFGYAS